MPLPLRLIGLNENHIFLLLLLVHLVSLYFYCDVNPIRVGGRLNQPALFSDDYFSMKKGVWRSKIS